MKTNELHTKIEGALRAERPLRQAPPGFAERVIEALPSRSVRAQREEETGVRAGSQSLWPRLAAAAALALVTFMTWRAIAPKTSPEPMIAHQAAPTKSTLPAPSLNAMRIEQIQALTAKIDQPLEKELARVMADTRSALRFVASNFMPEQN